VRTTSIYKVCSCRISFNMRLLAQLIVFKVGHVQHNHEWFNNKWHKKIFDRLWL